MFQRLIASVTAFGLFLLPASPVLAFQHAPEMARTQSPAQIMEDAVYNMAAQVLVQRGYDISLAPEEEAILQQALGESVFDHSIPINLELGSNMKAIVLVPLDAMTDNVEVPLAVFGPSGTASVYSVLIDGDVARIHRADGIALADVPLVFDDGALMVDLGHGATIFAIDLPDFSLQPLIDALQQVLDLLYTVKALINSIICATQAAVDLMYGLTYCGVGETEVGGGNVAGNVQCSVPKVTGFIETVSNYCF